MHLATFPLAVMLLLRAHVPEHKQADHHGECTVQSACLSCHYCVQSCQHEAPAHLYAADNSGSKQTQLIDQDGSWGAEMGLLKGLGTPALMWALLSESQDALLTHTLNQVHPHTHA